MRHFIREKRKTQHGFYYCQQIDSNTRWKRSSTSNKVRDAMTKKQIKGKKRIHGVHSRRENPYWPYGWRCKNLIFQKCFSRARVYSKSNQILFLFKDIARQYTRFSFFFFSTGYWHFATNRFPPGKRNTCKCRRYPRRTRNAQMFKPVSPK